MRYITAFTSGSVFICFLLWVDKATVDAKLQSKQAVNKIILQLFRELDFGVPAVGNEETGIQQNRRE